MPAEAIPQDDGTEQPWWATNTRPFRVGQVAKAWGMDPLSYLRLPERVRRFCEIWLLADTLKQTERQKQQDDHHHTTADHSAFAQQAQAWAQQITQQYKRPSVPK